MKSVREALKPLIAVLALVHAAYLIINDVSNKLYTCWTCISSDEKLVDWWEKLPCLFSRKPSFCYSE